MRFFKNKSKKKVEVPKPRELKDIQAEYRDLANKAGQVQYVIHAQQKNLQQINARLEYVNHEAEARNKLDKETAEKQKETPNEQK